MPEEDSEDKELSDLIGLILKRKGDQLSIDGAAMFNGSDVKDQMGILAVYKIKSDQNELQAPKEDKVGCIEEVAKLYGAQKTAFYDVLQEKGFSEANFVDSEYRGRIAVLTNHGTLILLGKLSHYRSVTTTRIHSPQLKIENDTCYVVSDLALYSNPRVATINRPGKPGTCYRYSPARAIAINPEGVENELEESENISRGIGTRTANLLMQPREHPVHTEDMVKPKIPAEKQIL